MKKALLIALATLCFSVFAYAAPECPFVERGTVHMGIDTTCWYFATDSGVKVQIVGGPNWIYTEGLSGVLSGNDHNSLMSNCQLGPIVEVCGFVADKASTLVGTLRYDEAAGKLWTITIGKRVYLMVCASRSFYQDGVKVKLTGFVSSNVPANLPVTDVVDVLAYESFGGSNKRGTPSAEAAAVCHMNYAGCRKVCAANTCFVSCDTLFAECLNH